MLAGGTMFIPTGFRVVSCPVNIDIYERGSARACMLANGILFSR